MVTQPTLFKGNKEEYQIYLQEQVDKKEITQEVAEAMLNAYTEVEDSSVEEQVKNDTVPQTFLEKLQSNDYELLTKGSAAELLNSTPFVDRNNIETLNEQDLQRLVTSNIQGDDLQAVQDELLRREEISERSFLDNLSSQDGLKRNVAAFTKGPTQTVNAIVHALPGLGLAIGGYITDSKTAISAGNALFEKFAEKEQQINDTFGTSEALNPTETFFEISSTALLPSSVMGRIGLTSADFLLDQSIRELIDTNTERYETVFDKVGLSGKDDVPTFSPIVAMGVGVLAATVSTAAVTRMMQKRIPNTPILRDISEIDPDAPNGLKTVEQAKDLTKANIVDEQQALKDIINRHGLVNADEINTRIEFDTHSAMRTRVKEATQTGKLKTVNATFDSPIAPKMLYDAFNSLDTKTRELVGRYINLKDYLDDLEIDISQGKRPASDANATRQQIQSIVQNLPMAEEFSKRYNSITAALRQWAEGGLFSSSYKLHLDKTRPNYVPLEISDVDPSAPLMQRLSQAQTNDAKQFDNDWLLHNRSRGDYDMDRRADPFVMLMQSVEATLSARMKNDTNLAIIDSLLANPTGSQTIRKVVKDDDLTANKDRLVTIYRDGKKETYITSKLTANLMRQDPYIAKYPALFVPKRIFEQAAVGPLSITFAPVTAIRDAIGGRVTRPDSLIAANPLEVISAIPEQLWARSQKAISNHLQANFVKGQAPLPDWLMSKTQQKKFADNISDAYNKTLYHQANMSGGFDASLMKSNIELARGSLAEIKRTMNSMNLGTDLPGVQFTKRRISNMIDGFTGIFNAIQEAPRYASIKKTVASGKSIDEATASARQMTGDVTKSGRVFNSDGRRMTVDAVDQGTLNFFNKGIGNATEVLRESTPFLNPMIQGNRRLLQSIVDDPLGFNARAWLNIGLPSLAIYGWNEMVGKEYNDYAMQQRSARDVVMTQYVAMPGRPPEEGIEIPLMHELLSFSAPFVRGLYALSRGEEQEKTRAALALVAENIFANSLEISTPVAGQAIANVAGFSGPESLLQPTEGVYKIRDDEIGLLPDNMEHLARTLFASIGDTAVNVATALSEDMSFETAYEEMKNSTLDRTPIVKNLSGRKKSNNYFSIPTQIARERFDAMDRFREYWDEFYNPDKLVENEEIRAASSRNLASTKDIELSEDLPLRMFGPSGLDEPLNPLYAQFGQYIVDSVQRNEQGMSGLIARANSYSKRAKELRNYNSGHKDALSEWQAMLNGLIETTDDTRLMKELLEDNNIELSNYHDRIRLINIIEEKRNEIINAQQDLIDQVEADITAQLQEQGIDVEFDVTKHLNPHDPNPLGVE